MSPRERRIATTSPTQQQLMWLVGWNLLTQRTRSYDLPRSNMAQQHPGAGGYKVEPGVQPNAGDHESVSWDAFPSLLCSVNISTGSQWHNRLSHGCMSVLSWTRACGGLPSLPEQSVPILTGVSCSFFGCNYWAAARLFLAKRGLPDLGGSFHREPELVPIEPNSPSLV